jgi:diaminobutyrate acetyltransferase
MLRTTQADQPTTDPEQNESVETRRPTVADGAALWRLARDSRVLDLNASYAYLLWCRDFAGTSIVATVDGEPIGFVTGYHRPAEPGTLMIWQVAVAAAHRGRGLARRMLDELVERTGPTTLETTITPDNEASVRLFSTFAARHGAGLDVAPVFDSSQFPDGHETELLYRIGPLG